MDIALRRSLSYVSSYVINFASQKKALEDEILKFNKPDKHLLSGFSGASLPSNKP